MPNTAQRLHIGDWLQRKHDHWDIIQVTRMNDSGDVWVRMLDGTEARTNVTYLRAQFERQDDDGATT